MRHACAVAHGYLELARSYGEPVDIEEVERVIARMRATLCKTKPGAVQKADSDGVDDRHVA